MGELEIFNQELSRLADEAIGLAKTYWASLEERPSFPPTSGKQTTELFSRPWLEQGRGRDVLQDFKLIAEHGRPSAGGFFGYVVGSGEPVGAVGELLAAVLNQNVTSWRSAPAATSIEHAVIGWLAEAIGCAGFSGSLCGGGSAANLMALAMAREAKLPANETETLRRGLTNEVSVAPHPYLKIGRRVGIVHGPLVGTEGILSRKKDQFRVVLSVDLIMRSVAIEVEAAKIEIAN